MPLRLARKRIPMDPITGIGSRTAAGRKIIEYDPSRCVECVSRDNRLGVESCELCPEDNRHCDRTNRWAEHRIRLEDSLPRTVATVRQDNEGQVRTPPIFLSNYCVDDRLNVATSAK